MSWFDTLLWPIKIVVAWILVGFHNLFTALGMSAAGGWSWALSIVGLVLVIRTLLIPLFVRQIRAARGLQLLSPELQAIQKKYKGKTDPASREAMSRETMELYRKHGTNPFSSCLPILAQSPIFFALFRVLANLELVAEGKYAKPSIGPITQSVAEQASSATIFGAPISSAFLNPTATTATRVVSMVLIVAMSITTFTTQRQLTQKNMPASALQGPMAQQQKMLLYAMPLLFAFSGVNFQIGVLIYWTTTNLWSMGQQFYVIRRNPTPGSEAERLLKERRARKAAAKGIVLEDEAPAIEEKPRGQREQPKRKDRARPTGAGGATGGAGTAAAGDGVQDSPARPAQRPAGSTGGQRAQGAKGGAGGKGAAAKAAGGAASGSTGAKGASGAKAGGTGAGTRGAKPAAGGSGARPARPARPTIPEEGTSKGGSSAADGDTPARPRRPKRPTTPPPADSDE